MTDSESQSIKRNATEAEFAQARTEAREELEEEDKHNPRIQLMWKLGKTALALLAVFSAVLSAFFILFIIRPPVQLLNPSVQVLAPNADEYEFEVRPAQACMPPGGVLEWNVVLSFAEDHDITVLRTVYEEDGTVVKQSVEYQSLRAVDAGKPEHRQILVPENIEPGEYFVLNSLTGDLSRPLRYRVPFTVAADCSEQLVNGNGD